MQHDLPLRVVHLRGGLRAVDDRSGKCAIQVEYNQVFGHFQTTEYSQLYSQLIGLSLPPLGCEFVNAASYQGQQPPDWELASPENGFLILAERNAWSNIRFAESENGNAATADIAGRTATYLQLLSIRMLQLSRAYNDMLRCWAQNRNRKAGHLFDNLYMTYVDAAVHAFVADAASFRDLITESIWCLVLQNAPRVTRLTSFRREVSSSQHPLADVVLQAANEGGWLFKFTALRNDIIHVAPIGKRAGLHMCMIQELAIGASVFPYLRYPLLDTDGAVRASRLPDLRTDEAARRSLKDYKAFVERSIDALDYAWDITNKLVELQRGVRTAAGLHAEFPHITDNDVIGDIVWLPHGNALP